MMFLNGRWATTFLLLISVGSLMLSVCALSSPGRGPTLLSNLFGGLEGPGYNFSPTAPMQPRAQELLDKLDMQSSLEPQLAKVEPRQISDLLAASAPIALRAAFGVFGLDYQLRWIPRDDEKYSYIATRSSQLEETCFSKAPQVPLILYDSESNAECRQIREACSVLSLTMWVRPVPRGGQIFGAELQQNDATEVPVLIDPNTSITLSDKPKIIKYLFATYGNGDIPLALRDAVEGKAFSWAEVSSFLAVGVSRLGAGGAYQFSNQPSRTIDGQPALTLWAYEGSPYCKLVRETLSSLELEHTIIYTPRGSPNRSKMWHQTGRVQFPYLEDANTGVALFESAAIVEYLQKQYALEPAAVKFM